MIPDDTDIAQYLSTEVKMESRPPNLAEVAQYVGVTHGEPHLFSKVREILSIDSEPTPVHRYLARFPSRFKELGLQERYQMIVTSQLDVALERAFLEQGEPFDVALYMSRETEYAGKFIHLPWGEADPRPVLTANEYADFPFASGYGELTRTVIVRMSGAVDYPAAGYRWKNNFLVTEDHYSDAYLGRRAPEEVVPCQILAKLREASCLFLGYTIADGLHRAFLNWIWGRQMSGAAHWAVDRSADIFERQFWQRNGVVLYGNRLTGYVTGLDKFLQDHHAELT